MRGGGSIFLLLLDALVFVSSTLTGELTPESDLGDDTEKSEAVSLTSCGKSFEFFSRNAWEVFSKLLGTPMSYHNPVFKSFARKRPGGSVLCTTFTIFRATIIFCFLVSPTYTFLFAATSSRKFMLPRWRLLLPPRPHRTSLECGFSMSAVICSGSESCGAGCPPLVGKRGLFGW